MTVYCRRRLPLLWVSCVLGYAAISGQQQTVPKMPAVVTEHPPASVHESFTYGVEWKLIRAGTAKLDWVPARGGWQADVHLESAGMVSKLYRVNDDYTAQLDGQLCASTILIKSEEGKRKRETKVTFDRSRGKSVYQERDLLKNSVISSKEIDIPGCVADIFGGMQKMRLLRLEPGQSAQIPISDGKKFANVKVEAQEREEVKAPAGTFKTVRYEVNLFNNVLIARSAKCFVWLTDDARKTPVQIRVRMQFLIGTINLLLEKEEHP